MEPEELKYLRKKEQYLSTWLSRYSKAKDIVPDVQKDLDLTTWGIHALENRPPIANEVPSNVDLSYYASRAYHFTRAALPMIPNYNSGMMSTASSTGIANASAIYSYVAKYADIPDSNAVDFANKQTGLYREIQAQQERPKEVRSLMQVFCTVQTLQRFDTATMSYLSSKSRAVTSIDSANSIRNTLYGFKGDLFEKARATPKENMTWVKMSQKLAKGVKESEVLTRNEVTLTSLISGLSEILKDRDHGSITNLDNLWTRSLDFMYTLLNLLKPVSQT